MESTSRTGHFDGLIRTDHSLLHVRHNGFCKALDRPRAGTDELLTIAAAEMDRLFEQMRGSGWALRLRDTGGGSILCERADASTEDAPDAHSAAWLTPARAPIHDAAGEIVAVLEATCLAMPPLRCAHSHTTALVRLSAEIIEKRLFMCHHARHRVLRFHENSQLVELLYAGALALADDGTVIGADSCAVRLLEVSDRYALVGKPINEVFDSNGLDLASPQLVDSKLWPVRDVRRSRRYYVRGHCGDSCAPPAEPRVIAIHSPALVHVTPSEQAPDLTLHALAGEDPQMLRNVRSACRIVDSGVSVLIQGPTGSGKEAFAHAMHLASKRAERPFIAVNCAAIPETLIESELFGYKPGAFTGARRDGMRGKILQSSGGTLFLDEIGDMPLTLQTRLLRVLEVQEIVPLGSETPIKVDLHVIAASHRNLREMIARGAFREDLYYRLNGITLELPALAHRADRERVIHRVLSVETGNGRPAAIEMDALQRLLAYPWPGNVRELRNVIRTALAICEGGVVRQIDLPREVRAADPSDACVAGAGVAQTSDVPAHAASANPLKAAERAALLHVIDECRGNMTRTAQQLGVSRNTLYRKMKSHGILARSLQRSLTPDST